MKLTIETSEKESFPSPFVVVLWEKEKPLSTLSGRDKNLWQANLDRILSTQNGKPLNRDSEIFHAGDRSLLWIQLPKKKGLNRFENLRLAAGTAWENAKSRAVSVFEINLNQSNPADVGAILEGLLYAEYDFRQYKSEPPKNAAAPSVILRVKASAQKACEALLKEIEVTFGHLRNLRDWVNTPGSDLDPETFAGIAQTLARQYGLTINIRDEKKLRKEGFLGLWTVGKGSDRPPRMVTLQYRGAPKNSPAAPHLCLVGKGVTFDTGGISIKPSQGMAEMKSDMAGAATVLAALCAIAELKLPLNASAVLCLAENRPGNAAVLPGDIFKAKNGKTVMVDNTDAEGRLVLSDGLFEAGTLQATHIIDIATLTGAVVRALGTSLAGLFANDREFASDIRNLGETRSEKFWELPLEEEYREWLEDPVADMKNVGKSEAGAITAALFLAEFVPAGVKWSHWDVAGTAFITSNWKYFKPGATGFGLKTLIEIAKSLA